MSTETFRTAYAKHVLAEYVRREYGKQHSLKKASELPTIKIGDNNKHAVESSPPSDSKIAIIGAGATGLAVALTLQDAGYKGVEILEAASRYGGRCYSYPFKNGPACEHNYYDVGAMRIPCISTMDSTFQMIDYLTARGQTIPLEPYIYDAGTEPSMYAYGQIDPKTDPDGLAFTNFMTNILQQYQFIDDKGQPLLPFDEAFANFINDPVGQPDNYSTRAWLLLNAKWTYDATEVAETLNTSTGLFDQAFAETVCDYSDFQQAATKNWKRVDGGMSVLTNSMYNVATKNGATVTTNCPVVAMEDTGDQIAVTYLDPSSKQPNTKSYDAVFNTTTFGCLERMDIQGLNLSAPTLTAIRALSYDRATKVAIKFNSPWWTGLVPNGGVSGTDLPISNVIYPSWNDGTGPTVMIVSYSWAQDATRMAAMVMDNDIESTDVNDPIVQLCFQNIVKLWKDTKTPITMQDLVNNYIAHHAFAWSHNSYTDGGFALFGPGQFKNMYPQFLQPMCNNKLWICGEAVSVHHAWISGAIDSAYMAVCGWLHGKNDTAAKNALKDGPLGAGKGLNVPEMSETLLFNNVELAQQRA